ncbi:MAG: pirin family protein [Chitinophagia bacterium]|nr:pirin family protein [Chitinophagia bacterium]
MYKLRSIRKILLAQSFDMGGFPIRQPLPAPGVDQIDPFLLLHHARLQVDAKLPVLEQGVGPHPHRGFSPVTFLFEGGVHHRDSTGNNSIIYAGGVQWMNAGRGLVHSERPPQDVAQQGGVQELIQLWINTPAKHKMDNPAYLPVAAEDMPLLVLPDGNSTIRIVSGEQGGIKGAIEHIFPVQSYMAQFTAGASFQFTLPATQNALIYILQGKLQIISEVEETAGTYQAVWFHPDGDTVQVNALEDTRFLVLAAEPLLEPVVARGPFVMNTREQLIDAFEDFHSGKMGELHEI